MADMVVAWFVAQDAEGDAGFISGIIDSQDDRVELDTDKFESFPDMVAIQAFPNKSEAEAWLDRERADYSPIGDD